jgi:hypothetical protein
MNSHLGTLLDWTVVDFVVLGIAIQQYVSISRDLKRDKARAKSISIESPGYTSDVDHQSLPRGDT